MGIKEARSYIIGHRKQQADPFRWPDFLTGMPDRPAVIKKVREAHPKLGRIGIAYLRIANIEPYLVKYGTKHHVEIIQWAAASITTAVNSNECFTGTLGGHDFIMIAPAAELQYALDSAARTFSKAIAPFYSKDDVSRGFVLEFLRDGQTVRMGLMRLAYAALTHRRRLSLEAVIPALEHLCSENEQASQHLP